tara:strand:- start:478 stop:714 length:237 start_codon:yes stop_codon:yes gene_type:complete
MKITKSQLKQIIKEEMEDYGRESELSDKEEAVRVMAEELVEAIREMGNSNPELTDYYIMILRALRDAGVNIKALAGMS